MTTETPALPLPYSWIADRPSAPHWGRIGGQRRLGVAIPLFSARTGESCGIGEFPAIERLVDWCGEIGATVLQLLPLNDIGDGTSPYSAWSAFALDPTYISLHRLAPRVDDASWLRRVEETARELERSPRVDYPRVRAAKLPLLEEAFRRCQDDLARDPDYLGFLARSPWLDGYAAFRVLKEDHGYASWEVWGAGWVPGDRVALTQLHQAARLDFIRFQQFVAAEQLAASRRYAEERGVLLQGDIPILVSRDSADVWLQPHLFHLDAAAGAPPDMYAADGQNWGFPTYRWDRLARQDYAWWRARLRTMEDFCHLYRVDHVVGFFRIWTIPQGLRDGRQGRFVPEDEGTWGEHGQRLLEMMLGSCRLLPLAEDLGTVPDVCRHTLGYLAIPGLKVARWEKRWHGDRSFIPPAEFLPMSVATSATHDSETLAGWWKAFPEERQQLQRELGLGDGPAPARLPPALAERILGDLARAGSIFTILPLADLLELARDRSLGAEPEEDRINVPGELRPDSWTWRLRRPLEELLADASLNVRLLKLLERG